MPLRFKCPGCKALYAAPDEMAGRQTRCKKCQTVLPMTLRPDQPLPSFKRIFLVPAADRIVTIPSDAEVHFQHFSFTAALENAPGDYLFVTPFAPPVCNKGEPFLHDLATRSKAGGVKYQLLSGPQGMSISENGKVTWSVPKDAMDGVSEVRIRLQDASGRELVHSFRVRVE